MDSYERDQIWHSAWKIYYDAYFQEILSEKIVLRWHRFDDISKLLIALTASTSALSGWALWSDPGIKTIWALVAGFSAILAITHKSLDVSSKLADWGSARSKFSALRIDFEKFQNEMKFNPEFSINDFSEECGQLQNCYKELYQNTKIDGFLTNRLRNAVQKELNNIISDN